MLHQCNHYEPVVVVEDTLFSKPPYLRIGDYVPRKFQMYVSQSVLDAALVNNHTDIKILQDLEKGPETIYVQTFKEQPYQISGMEQATTLMDPNIFNLLCDEVDFA
jgi:hypothetical protein